MKLKALAVLGLILGSAVLSISSTAFACGESNEVKAGVAKNVDKEQEPAKKADADGTAKDISGDAKK